MAVLATDDFDRANEDPLDNGVWTEQGSGLGFKIVSTVAVPFNNNLDSYSTYTGIAWPDDQYSQVDLVDLASWATGAGVGVVLRVANPSNYYRVAVSSAASNNVQLRKRVGAVNSTLLTVTQAMTSGDTLKVEVQGNTLRLYKNGVQFGGDVTGDLTLASGDPGLFNSSPTSTSAGVDNWEGGSIDATASGIYVHRPITTSRGVSW